MDLRVAVAAPPGHAQQLSDRVTRAVEGELPQACAQALGSLGDGDAVIRIREISLRLATDADAVRGGALPGQWARVLAEAVREAIESSPGAVRFDSPLDYLAAFLRDLSDGRAWGRWYWDELRPLRSIRPGAAAATLLSARPGWIEPVLGRLEAGGGAERLIARLAEEDVRRVWAALALPEAPALPDSGAPAWAAVEAVWPRLVLERAPHADARARDSLRAWLALAGEHGPRADRAAVALALALVELAALLADRPDARAVLAGDGRLDREAVIRLAWADALAWIEPAAEDGRLARALALADPKEAARGKRRTGSASPFGAVLLIAPALVELGVWELWLDELGAEPARRNIVATALKALGRERAPLALGDDALALLAGLPGPPAADARLPVEPEPGLAWVDALADRVAGRELVRARLPDMDVLRDPARAAWIVAWPQVADPPGRTLGGRTVRAASAPELESVAAEAAHLQLGRRVGFPWLTPGLDAALSAVASMAVRATARRIPGFAEASLGYVARHFLAQPARLAGGGGELVAELEGGPLAVALGMADLPESQQLPWADASLRFRIGTGA